jgi:hypothetical protein
VACPTASACTAFGLNLTGSGPLAHPAHPRTRDVRHRLPRCGLPHVIGLLRRSELRQQRPEPDPGRAMESHNERFPASHQPPGSTRAGPRVQALPEQHGRIRLAAQPRTVVALVLGPGPSRPDQSNRTRHTGLVPAHVKAFWPFRVRIPTTKRRVGEPPGRPGRRPRV